MARRRRYRRKKKSMLDYIRLPSMPSLDLDPDTKKGVLIVFILALGTISLLGLFDMAGLLGQYLKQGLMLGFGWGKWVFPVILLALGYMLYDDERFDLGAGNYLGLILFVFSFQTLLFLFVECNQWPGAVEAGIGGGYVGLLLANVFIKLMGFIASLLVTVGLLIVSLLLLFDTTLVALFGADSVVAKVFYPINFIIAKIFRRGDDDEDEDEDDEEDDEDNEDDNEDEDEDDEDDNEDEDEDDEEDDEDDDEDEDDKGSKEPKFVVKEVKEDADVYWWMKPTGLDFKIPHKLLDGRREKPTSGDIEDNKEIIRNALKNFGIESEMGNVSVGPTVTQYTFRPAEGIKLSRITNLSNDLALALAAHPIRIEAPIPGTHLVGVEVPNQVKAVVSFKEVLSSKYYKERKTNMQMALGKDVAGKVWLDDITKMPHLLVAGATNSGKSVCLNSIIVSLMYQNTPDEVRFIMVDPKRVELPVYNNIPYLLTPVITEVPKTINALKWCLNEMDRRFELLQKTGVRNIQGYNETADVKMPYVIFVIDELADLMVAAAKDIEAGVIRLAQMARAVGIHLILATQRPSVDVITGLIKANMPGRIAFSVASGTDSRTILDMLGAEKLLGRGDMLYINAELSKPVRLQGAFLSDSEIKRVVRFIKAKSKQSAYLDDVTERQTVKGIGGVGLDGLKGDEDELLHEAKEIILKYNKASASLLQRRLRVGYARAASILDQLEELGYIGPSNGSKPREILISPAEAEAIDQQGTSGVSIHSRVDSKPHESYLGEDEPETPPVFEDDPEEELRSHGASEEEESDEDEEESDEDNRDNEDSDEENNKNENEDDEESEEDDSEDDDDNEDEEEEGKFFAK